MGRPQKPTHPSAMGTLDMLILSRLVRGTEHGFGIAETLLLFVLGGAAGVALARVMTSLLVTVLPSTPVPIDLSFPLDGRVLLFTAGLSLVAAVLSGLVPALQASKSDVVSALKNDSQGPSDRLRLRGAFVVAQVAFSILLVVGAGLFVRALQRSSSVALGFDPRGVQRRAQSRVRGQASRSVAEKKDHAPQVLTVRVLGF